MPSQQRSPQQLRSGLLRISGMLLLLSACLLTGVAEAIPPVRVAFWTNLLPQRPYVCPAPSNGWVTVDYGDVGQCISFPRTGTVIAMIPGRPPLLNLIAGVRLKCSLQSPAFDKLELFTNKDCSGTPAFVLNQKRTLKTCLQNPDTFDNMKLTCARPMDDCVPKNSLNEDQCLQRMGSCGSRHMKWTGPGCREPRGKGKGKLLRDGGCQCLFYCGYKCKAACNSDPFDMCAWNDERGVCTNKETHQDGVPITVCPSTGVGGGRPGKDPVAPGNLTDVVARFQQLLSGGER